MVVAYMFSGKDAEHGKINVIDIMAVTMVPLYVDVIKLKPWPNFKYFVRWTMDRDHAQYVAFLFHEAIKCL